jgi:hypothetical protein
MTGLYQAGLSTCVSLSLLPASTGFLLGLFSHPGVGGIMFLKHWAFSELHAVTAQKNPILMGEIFSVSHIFRSFYRNVIFYVSFMSVRCDLIMVAFIANLLLLLLLLLLALGLLCKQVKINNWIELILLCMYIFKT